MKRRYIPFGLLIIFLTLGGPQLFAQIDPGLRSVSSSDLSAAVTEQSAELARTRQELTQSFSQAKLAASGRNFLLEPLTARELSELHLQTMSVQEQLMETGMKRRYLLPVAVGVGALTVAMFAFAY